MKQAAKVGLNLLQHEKPHSSISVWIDTLCQERYLEDDYDGITELVESVNLQAASTGPTEASRSIRKKLKYSNVHGQLRALTILKALVENCGPRFQTTFANERLVDRIKLMVADPTCDEKVKRKIMSVLSSWYRLFRDDKGMQLVAGLYATCGGGKKTVDKTAYDNEQARYSREASDRAERKMQERKNKEKEKERLEKEKEDRKNKNKPKVKRIPFNFEAEKPQIMATVGSATQSAQNLINALQLVNRERESIITNERVVECLAKAKADRKIVVRYIQQVENDTEGDYIGTLLATNEQVLTALALYDRYSKPTDLDSDDEYVAALQNTANQQGLRVFNQNADDTMSIRSRLSAFDIRDNEVDKLQGRQWRNVERENSRRNQSRGAAIHPDLQDLAFGPTPSGSTLPSSSANNQSRASEHYSHGSLAEYSDGTDYSSSDGEEVPSHFGAPPTSFSSSTAGTSNEAVDARSYARFIQKDDARLGKGLLVEDEEDDPFADPDGGGGGGDYGYDDEESIRSGKRKDWREV